MGTLERLRKTSPYALGAFALIFVGFMVASDANIGDLLQKGTNYQTAILGKINDGKIYYKEFEAKVREQVEQQKTQNPNDEGTVDDLQIRRSLWSQLSEELLLGQEAEKMGIFVSREEILDVLLENPPDYLKKPFTDSAGNFQRENYLEIITNPDVIFNRLPEKMSKEERKNVVQTFRNDLLRIQKYLYDEKLGESIKNVVNTTGSIISPLYARQKYLNENSSADVAFIYFDPKTIDDKSVTVTDDEIEKYYSKIKQYNIQKPKRKLKYITFPIVPSASDSAHANKIIKKLYQDLLLAKSAEDKDSIFEKKFRENKGEAFSYTQVMDIPPTKLPFITGLQVREVFGPISLNDGTYFFRLDGKRSGENIVVKASHILLPFGTNKDSAKAEAEKILKKAKAGEDFGMLARMHSIDQGSARSGGDLGFFGKGRMVKPFEDAAFAASVGSIVGPVESQFGYHIIKVTDKKSDELKYSEIKVKPEISRMTMKALGRDAKIFKDKIDAGTSFETEAKSFNKVIRETDFFDADKPALGSMYLAATAFRTDVGKAIEPLELKNQGIIVAQVSDSREEGLVPLKDLKEKIKKDIIKIKKLDALKPKALEVYKKVKAGGQLTAAAGMINPTQLKVMPGVQNTGYVAGLGQDFAFTEKAFNLPVGQISEPLRGENGYYILQVTNRHIPDEKAVKSALPEYLSAQRKYTQGNSYFQWFAKVKEDAKITDDRSQYYKEY